MLNVHILRLLQNECLRVNREIEILKLLPSDYRLPFVSKTTFQSVPNGRELSSSDFSLFGQNWAESTYLIVDSCLTVIHNSFRLLSLDRNSLGGKHLLIAA